MDSKLPPLEHRMLELTKRLEKATELLREAPQTPLFCARCHKAIHYIASLGWCDAQFSSPNCINAGGHSPEEATPPQAAPPDGTVLNKQPQHDTGFGFAEQVAKLPAQPGDGPEEALRDAANDWYETTGFTLDHLDGLAQEAFKAGADWQASRSREDGWISVQERLPEPHNNDKYTYTLAVLVCEEGTRDQYAATLWRCPDGTMKWEAQGETTELTVTHWQPLPTPPKEGGKA